MKKEEQESSARRLRTFAESAGLRVRPGLAESELNAVELKLGVRLPPSLRKLFTSCGGTGADEVFELDPNRHIRFWPEFELRLAEHDETGDWGRSVVFADYLLNSVEFAVALDSGAIIALNGHASARVATDVDDFIARYIADDPKVFGTGI